jgi:hypothetical protein
VLCASPSAHRLDEYLQAARLSLGRTGITLEIDLTPGAAVAAEVIAAVDRDGDSRIVPLEAQSYARAVLADMIVELDGQAIPMSLLRVESPSVGEMRHGLGTMHIRAEGRVERGVGRTPQLHFRNSHQPWASVYLVNALVPSDTAVSVVSQTRDARQQDLRIDYNVTPQWPKQLYWPMLGLGTLLIAFRRSLSVNSPGR